MKFRIALLVFCLAFVTSEADAAVKVMKSKAAITVLSPIGSGDQILDFTVNSAEIALVGTIENGLINLVTSPTLGGSDGFISAIDKTKAHLWDLRLGTANDDVATAVTRDKSGFFWITGATSLPVETTNVTVDETIINIDSVTVDEVIVPKNSLTRLLAWKVSSAGELIATYSYDADGVIVPTSINFDGTNFKVIGSFSKSSVVEQFQISLNQQGSFSGFATINKPKAKVAKLETIKAGINNLKSFISKTTIIDIPSWRAKSPTPVIVKYTKAGKALAANSFAGGVKKILWQTGIGAVVLVEVNSDNELHILMNMS